ALKPAEDAASAPAPTQQEPALQPANDNRAPAEQPKPAAETPSATPLAADAASQPAAQAPAPAPDNPAQAQESPPAPAADAPAAAPQTSNVASEADPAKRVAALLAQGMKGPAEIRIADRATLFLPAGRILLAGEKARELAKAAGLELRPETRAVIAPESETLRWLAPVELLDAGYIRSEGTLEADKLLAAFSAGLAEVNARRATNGQPAVDLTGWLSAPAIDDKHRVSACVNVMTQGGGDKYFNCEAWALGRDGAIKISLAEGGDEGEKLKGEAKALAEAVVFDHGRTYEAFDPASDKVAPYAVADLLTSDVTSKSAPTSPPDEEEGASLGPVDWLIEALKFWKVILFGVVAITGVVSWRRRRVAGKLPDRPTGAVETATERPKQAAQKSGSGIFAKLFPILHAKFSRGGKPATETAPTSTATGARPTPLESAAPQSQPHSQPTSAFQKLAMRMRRTDDETPAEKPDMSRVMRNRTLPGAAPAPETAATRAPEAPRIQDAPMTARDLSNAPIDDLAQALKE
ncbi:MAG: DUF2167 domain-containing protein, partial [Methylocystis sp.]|nr:DUF2167 domain-containing protein [Methylocystis sp.]